MTTISGSDLLAIESLRADDLARERSRLHRLASASLAASPCPWEVDTDPRGGERHRGILTDTRKSDCDHVVLPGSSYLHDVDAQFIAAANPAAVLSLLRDVARLTDQLADVTRELDRANNQFVCLTCGTGVKADEDGCCSACGADCLVIEHGEMMLGSADSVTSGLLFDVTRDVARLTAERDEARRIAAGHLALIAAGQRGFDDLHSMVPGSGDIWTKVDALKKSLASRDTTIAELRAWLGRCRAYIAETDPPDDALADEIDAALGKEPTP